MGPLRLWRWVFPTKAHPEDLNTPVAFLARGIFFADLIALVYALPAAKAWSTSSNYVTTEGILHHDWAPPARITNSWFTYEAEGRLYSSHTIAFGGRIGGQLPPAGPVVIHYDPANPHQSVLHRRPADAVIAALLFGFCSPWIARFVWRTYA